MTDTPATKDKPGLTTAEGCIAAIWPDPVSRPGLRTFRKWQANGWIPVLKISRRTFFDPEHVRAALERRFTIHAR